MVTIHSMFSGVALDVGVGGGWVELGVGWMGRGGRGDGETGAGVVGAGCVKIVGVRRSPVGEIPGVQALARVRENNIAMDFFISPNVS